jgi:Ca2+-binding RTX toxin-like protein
VRGRYEKEGAEYVKKLLGIAIIGAMAFTIGGSTAKAEPVNYCGGERPTITGSGVINGTTGNDVIMGSAGGDTIYGKGGDDIICGQGGDDFIDGGTGDDTIYGEYGSKGTAIGDPGNDTIYGGSGDDVIIDEYYDGEIYGGSGRDFIRAAGVIFGEAGADDIGAVYESEVPTSVDGGTGQDRCLIYPAQGDTKISCELTPTV